MSRLEHWPEGIEAEEHIWRDYYTGEKLEDYTLPWRNKDKDSIDGNTSNCILYQTEEPVLLSWQEWQCTADEIIGCPCSYKHAPILRMRGFCKATDLEHITYAPKELPADPGEIIKLGAMSAILQYNNSHRQWVLSDPYSNVSALTNASQISYALGKHNWTIVGDNSECSRGQPSYTIEMKLTGCKADEFTCNDGQCVDLSLIHI